MHVFVTGATGLIGRAVCETLLSRGYGVTGLTRSGRARLPPGMRVVQGNPLAPGPWQDELARCDACVHLAGEPIADRRWTSELKRRIRESRVRSTANVAAVLRVRGPGVLVSGSAVGYYGSRGDEVLEETSAPGTDFLAEVTQAWEDAAAPAEARARVVKLRTAGMVFAAHGGALPRLVRPFRLFAGGPLAGGAFWQSWIHIADEVGLILFALEEPRARGPLVSAAPEPVRNRDLARAIGEVLGRPSALPVPAAAVRLVLGEVADVVLSSQRVVPKKALELGYQFRFPAVESALRDLLK